MTVSASIGVSPAAPQAGQQVTAAYSVQGNSPGTPQTATLTGQILIGGVEEPVTETLTIGGAPAAAVAYAVPACPGLAFQATANPAVFTAVVPATLATSGAATVSGSVTVGGGTPIPVSAPITLPSSPAPAASSCYFGVWDDASGYPADGTSYSWAGVQKFAAAPVRSATYYLAWLGPFPTGLNTLAKANGATLYLNLEPQDPWGGGANPTVPDIAAGKYDSWLTQIGQAIKAGGNVVRVTWAHEMNGNWYPWGTQAITAKQWIAGWTHVYQVIKAAAGNLAQMTWAPNNNDGGRAVTPFWPGASLVDVVAMDAYLNTANASQTYASFIAPTVAEIRKLTSQPIWNAETGVLGTNREARITQFVSDMHSAGLSGFTWFNEGSYLLDASELAALCAAVNAWDAS